MSTRFYIWTGRTASFIIWCPRRTSIFCIRWLASRDLWLKDFTLWIFSSLSINITSSINEHPFVFETFTLPVQVQFSYVPCSLFFHHTAVPKTYFSTLFLSNSHHSSFWFDYIFPLFQFVQNWTFSSTRNHSIQSKCTMVHLIFIVSNS